jgi:hypothetical protein
MTQYSTDEIRGYFPFEYYNDFLKFLHKNRRHIEIITYDDIDWCESYDYKNAYPEEWKGWKKSLGDKRSKSKIYLLIQHDVDATPFLTTRAMESELKYGIKSNIMMFRNRVKRRHLQDTGELVFDDKYSQETSAWKKFEKHGFVFCYHANSYEQALFDREKASDIFEQDVNALRAEGEYGIKYFSPHGGARCPQGLSNTSMEIPDNLKSDIRWVANGATLKFNGVFSDGGPNSMGRDPNQRDLRDFVSSWKPGNRYRVITHPQYYVTPCNLSDRLSEAEWYRSMQDGYSSANHFDYWEGCKLGELPIAKPTSLFKKKVLEKLWSQIKTKVRI